MAHKMTIKTYLRYLLLIGSIAPCICYAEESTCFDTIKKNITDELNSIDVKKFDEGTINDQITYTMTSILKHTMENGDKCESAAAKVAVNGAAFDITIKNHTFAFKIDVTKETPNSEGEREGEIEEEGDKTEETVEKTLPADYIAPNHTVENDKNGTYAILFSPRNSTQTPGEAFRTDNYNNKVFWDKKCADHSTFSYIDDNTDINKRIQKSQMSYDNSADYFLLWMTAYKGLLMSDILSISETAYPVRQKTKEDIHYMALWLTKLLKGGNCAGLDIYTVKTEYSNNFFQIIEIVGGPYHIQ